MDYKKYIAQKIKVEGVSEDGEGLEQLLADGRH